MEEYRGRGEGERNSCMFVHRRLILRIIHTLWHNFVELAPTKTKDNEYTTQKEGSGKTRTNEERVVL